MEYSAFYCLGLNRGDGDGIDNVRYGAAAAQIIDRLFNFCLRYICDMLNLH